MSTTALAPLALSPRQVAERLGGSLRWVNGLLADNTLPSCRVAGRRLIRAVDLDALLVPSPFSESAALPGGHAQITALLTSYTA